MSQKFVQASSIRIKSQQVIRVTWLVALFSMCGGLPQAQTVESGKLFIIGGGKRPAHMIARLISEAQLSEKGYGVILPMSSSEPDSSIYYALIQFKEQGLTNVVGMDIDSASVTRAQLDSLRAASMIYISGGDQNRFMRRAKGSHIAETIRVAYRNGCVVAGTSAGAALMSERMITGDERNYPDYNSTFRNIEPDNIIFAPGLGLLPTAIVDQHFVKRSRYNRLISAVMEYPDLLGIGIDESTAILVSGSTAEVVGDAQVIVLKAPDQSTKVLGGKMGLSGIQLDVLLPGDTFDLE